MVLKTKHSKHLKKRRAKREVEKKKNEPEIDFDTSAYVIYNRLEMTYPCLSFDIVSDNQAYEADRVGKFPLSLNIIAGAQTPPHVENNYIYVIKVDNINALKQDKDSEESDADDEDEPEVMPNLTSIRVTHKGCVNRLRTMKREGKVLTASWSDKGKVYIYDLTTPLLGVADQRSIKTYTAQKTDPKPVFTFGGHLCEGYAVDWAPLRPGSLATGDCKKNIHIWTMRNQLDWNVDQQPLVGHESSVEDIKWSPDNADVLASCSVDKSLRLWDLRLQATARCVAKVLDSHQSDVNVIDWNRRSKNLIVSGGDDGVVKVWDNRYLMAGGDHKVQPVARFEYHKKPITSVEWNPNDDTVMAVASEDNKLTLWDLAVEKDDEQEGEAPMDAESDKSESSGSSEDESEDGDDKDDEDEDEKEDKESDKDVPDQEDGIDYKDLKTIPEQMLFLHQGQVEIKELHWHPQLNGLLISTALNGINIFKTISA